eukprot:3222066-Prymnesium_polylepis.1
MTTTFSGNPVPRAPIEATVDAIVGTVLNGTFSDWRYTNPARAHTAPREATPSSLLAPALHQPGTRPHRATRSHGQLS